MKINTKFLNHADLGTSVKIERCGLIFGIEVSNTVYPLSLVEVLNTSDTPDTNFSISKQLCTQAKTRTRLVLLGYWHTHTSQGLIGPSEFDFSQMENSEDKVGMVYHVPTGTITWFNNNIIKKEIVDGRH